SLPLAAWEDTFATLHRWTQIVGKIRLAQTPWINHSWHVPLYVTARGLTTSRIPHGARTFEIAFDFLDHRLLIQSSDGGEETLALRPQTVAEFYSELLRKLGALELGVSIHGRPNELEDATPFAEDRSHASYDPEYAARFWRALVQADRVLQEFRVRFIGKCSPIHFFWGSFDLAVTRFSGRPAPAHPGGIPNLPDWVVREAYSHEVSSCGFWPGGGPHPFPLFYSYAYPEPNGFAAAAVEPAGAFYSNDLREWVLPYDVVRSAASPDDALLAFLETTYAAAADLAHWDRSALERCENPRPAV
ncbi:MAG: DUF5996 family protein, partial [Chromatiaceae bacterium]